MLDCAMVQAPQIPSSYMRMVARELEGLVTSEQMLMGTELDSNSLALAEFVSLAELLLILRNVKRVTSNPAIGLRLGSLLHPSTHGSVGWATINSPSLADAITVLSRYSTLQVPFVRYDSSVTDKRFCIRITPMNDLVEQHAVLMECMLLLLQHVIEYVVGHPLKEARISVDYPPPAYAKEYQQYFDCPVEFNKNVVEFTFPAEYRHLPSSTANADMLEIALDQCQKAERRLQERGDLVATVYDLIEKHMEEHLTLEQVAFRLNISPRTLIRRLKKQDTSFQSISDRFYAQTAADYMKRTDISVNAVSQLLGYKDPANFRRSFKRWFKETPAHYRKQNS